MPIIDLTEQSTTNENSDWYWGGPTGEESGWPHYVDLTASELQENYSDIVAVGLTGAFEYATLIGEFPQPNISTIIGGSEAFHELFIESEIFEYIDPGTGEKRLGLNTSMGSNGDVNLHIWTNGKNCGLEVNQRAYFCGYGGYYEEPYYETHDLQFKIEMIEDGTYRIVVACYEEEIDWPEEKCPNKLYFTPGYFRDVRLDGNGFFLESSTSITSKFDGITYFRDKSGRYTSYCPFDVIPENYVPDEDGIMYWIDADGQIIPFYKEQEVVSFDFSEREEAILFAWLKGGATGLINSIMENVYDPSEPEYKLMEHRLIERILYPISRAHPFIDLHMIEDIRERIQRQFFDEGSL